LIWLTRPCSIRRHFFWIWWIVRWCEKGLYLLLRSGTMDLRIQSSISNLIWCRDLKIWKQVELQSPLVSK
jgi:hypothetical protein